MFPPATPTCFADVKHSRKCVSTVFLFGQQHMPTGHSQSNWPPSTTLNTRGKCLARRSALRLAPARWLLQNIADLNTGRRVGPDVKGRRPAVVRRRTHSGHNRFGRIGRAAGSATPPAGHLCRRYATRGDAVIDSNDLSRRRHGDLAPLRSVAIVGLTRFGRGPESMCAALKRATARLGGFLHVHYICFSVQVRNRTAPIGQ